MASVTTNTLSREYVLKASWLASFLQIAAQRSASAMTQLSLRSETPQNTPRNHV